MFDLGMQELIVIFVVALIVFGPKRLPELARSMGKAMGQLRSAVSDVKTEVEKEIRMAETGLDIEDMPAWKRRDEGPAEQPPGERESEKSKDQGSQPQEEQGDQPQETDPAEHESQDLEEDGRDKQDF